MMARTIQEEALANAAKNMSSEQVCLLQTDSKPEQVLSTRPLCLLLLLMQVFRPTFQTLRTPPTSPSRAVSVVNKKDSQVNI